MSARPALLALAGHAGILDGYHSALDGSWVATSDATRETLLAAMGHDASDEAGAGRALEALRAERGAAPMEPLCVAVAGSPEARRLTLAPAAGLPEGTRAELRIEGEDGDLAEHAATVDASGALKLPDAAPDRYRITLEAPGGGPEGTQIRYVVPARCTDVEQILGQPAAFGLQANLYSLRSDQNWGFGHFGDLTELVRRAGREGAAFVGLNPLHALAPGDVCPYVPQSRLFRHRLYLDPERIPELARCPEARRLIESAAFRERLARLRSLDRLDPDGVGAALDAVLEPLHDAFAAGACGTERTRAFERYAEEQGPELEHFALFSALSDHFATAGPGRDWRTWPQSFRSPDGEAVDAFRAAHRRETERHAWIQFELDRQLGEAARAAREAGLALGLYTDLALGSDPGGADAWAFPGLLVRGVRVGAPPDAFARDGQEWGFSPTDPAALRRDGHSLWLRLLRAAFRHAGAMRLDHAMSLNRLFWIPEGRPPSEGAYVRYPDDELLGIVALESRRWNAAVVAEDLGTVPDGFAEQLGRRGILSSRVLLFERDGDAFRPAERYPRGCLATANTHDLPPLAALAGDADLELRRRAGQIADDSALERARAERAAERGALLERLQSDGWLDTDTPSEAELAAAVTAFLCATPAVLVGVAVDDLAGETEPVNLPGVPRERHPSWTRRLAPSLDALWQGAIARACLRAIPPQRRLPRPAGD